MAGKQAYNSVKQQSLEILLNDSNKIHFLILPSCGFLSLGLAPALVSPYIYQLTITQRL